METYTADTSYSNLEKGDDRWEKCKRYLAITAVVVGAIVGFISLILASVAYAQIHGFTNDYDSTVQSWELSPITDITFVSPSVSCPSGYSALQSQWPGTWDACNCYNIPNTTSSDTRSCTTDEYNKGCDNRYGRPAVTLDALPNTKLCYTRWGPGALDRPQDPDPTNPSCPSGFQICGVNTSLTCYPSSNPCPITDMAFSTLNINDTESWANGSKMVGSTGYYFYFARGGSLNPAYFDHTINSPGSQPLTLLPIVNIDFQASDPCTLSGCGYGGRSGEYNQMSQNYKMDAPNTGYTQRPLPCDGGCTKPDVSNSVSPSGRDTRFFRLYNITERSLYLMYNPSIPSDFITSNTNYYWYISVRSEIYWSSGCPENRQSVEDRQDEVDGVDSAQAALLVFSIFAFIFVSILFPVLQYCAPEKYEPVKQYEKPCKWCLKIAVLACTLATMIIALGTLWYWNSINDYNKEDSSATGATKSCSDPLTDETFSTLGSTFYSLSNKNILNTASVSITSVVDVAHEVVSRCL